jgi:hypothetical protein
MNKARNLVEMGEFYASTVLTEAKKEFPPKGTFATPGKKTSDVVTPKGLKTKAFDKRGPLSNKNDEALVKPLEAKDAKGKSTFTGVEKLSLAPEKMEVENINNFMNKSIFDRLYEDVMNDNIASPADAEQHDAEALGLPGTEEHEGEVTITLDRELAGKLHDALMAVLGSEEEQIGDEEGELEGEEDEESDDTLPEATELKEIPASAGASLQSKKNIVGDETSKLVSKGHGDGNVDNKVDGSGKTIKDIKIGAGVKADTTAVSGKSNTVASSKTSKVGSYIAGN